MSTRSFLTLSLLAVLLLVGCSPVAVPVSAPSETPVRTFVLETEPHSQPVVVTEAFPTEEASTTVTPEFVPRGPNLEATDPSTVSLVSGGVQLVEFFRFT